ncbi:Fic/DOC family protein [Chryseobacterium herbae]|uniref:protein adenylyltransferase n=1 Tax=Chryseobacterium herbae TaxID=2976476 RepID=A0ABT2ISY8_9FLAO|nr:Fic family protein [Chryseobacterium sp. pc1-10]MCT2561902.1 Fic family protein [Chryseobacterium sp. pc1-10]
MKYEVSRDESEILSNKLGLKSLEEIGIAEFEGFLQAEIILTESLQSRTRFNNNYILKIHKLALAHLYNFAGKYRNVNISKGGFLFSSAKFLKESMRQFEDDILLKLSSDYKDREALIRDVAMVHGELLFIHPFREGNGRTARILANLMVRKAGFNPLEFEKIKGKEFEQYIIAVQSSAAKNYEPMMDLIEKILPS